MNDPQRRRSRPRRGRSPAAPGSRGSRPGSTRRSGRQAEDHRDAVLEVELGEPTLSSGMPEASFTSLKPSSSASLPPSSRIRDRALPDRDHDHLVEGGQRSSNSPRSTHSMSTPASCFGALQAPPACSWRERLRIAFTLRSVVLLVRRLDQERHLGDRRAGPARTSATSFSKISSSELRGIPSIRSSSRSPMRYISFFSSSLCCSA